MKTPIIIIILLFTTCLVRPFISVAQTSEIKVRYTEGPYCSISGLTGKNFEIEWNNKPDDWKETKKVKLTVSSDSFKVNTVHPIIRFKENGKARYFAPRAVVLEGTDNFRDIGGYWTRDGKQVKWGKIYRSAEISKITEKDQQRLLELSIHEVFDLRGDKECAAAPDNLPPGISRIHLPAGSEHVGPPGDFLKNYLTNSSSRDSLMLKSYARTGHFKAKYKPMFDSLLHLKDDEALLFHCTAGKDRTGIGAALILSALGVEENEIMEDYLATNNYWVKGKQEFRNSLTEQGVSEESVKSLFVTKEAHLKTTFSAISKQYGSIDQFLFREMELTPEKIQVLKSKLLYQ